MSLLSVIKRASVLLNSDAPSSLQGAGKITRQLVEFAKIDAEDLAQRHEWQELEADWIFSTAATEVQPDGLPPDFGRFAYGGDLWNRSRNQRICSLSRGAWEAIKAGSIGGVYNQVRIVGGRLYLVPAPAAGETVAFPFISSNLYASKDGVAKSDWEADDDVCRLPEKLIALGIVWRWRQARGFAYAEDMATYERQLSLLVPAGPDIVIGCARYDDIPLAYPGVLG